MREFEELRHRGLDLVALDFPYTHYGGGLDIFHRIRLLAQLDVPIHLHYLAFEPGPESRLKPFCRSIQFYRRKTPFPAQCSFQPYAVTSRRVGELVQKLKASDRLILLEGQHCSGILQNLPQSTLRVGLRSHNREPVYYRHQARSENKLWRKAYLHLEAMRLQGQEKALSRVGRIWSINPRETEYFRKYAPSQTLLPFHGHEQVMVPQGVGKGALYFGNLMVSESRRAAQYLAREVFPGSTMELHIAGRSLLRPDPFQDLGIPNVHWHPNPSEEELSRLIREAQLVIIPDSGQAGIKLKLIRALFTARHILIPDPRPGRDLFAWETTAHLYQNARELRDMIKELRDQPVSKAQIQERKEAMRALEPMKNARDLATWLEEMYLRWLS